MFIMENTMMPPPPSEEQQTDPRPKIVFCIPGKQFSDTFLQSWTNCLLNLFGKYNMVLSSRYSSMVNFARALCLGADVTKGPNQKPFQGQLNYDAMVWLDSDMAFNPDTLDKLIQRCLNDKPVVSGTYFMDGGRNLCCVENWDKEHYKKNGSFQFLTIQDYKERMNINEDTKDLDENKDIIVNAAYAGMGCMAIRKGVIEDDRMKYPWFFRNIEHFCNDAGHVIMSEGISEDVAFIRNLIDSGVIDSVTVYLNLRFGHEKTVLI
jgi:hypothetical protein